MHHHGDDFREYRRLLLHELDRLGRELAEVAERAQAMQLDIELIKQRLASVSALTPGMDDLKRDVTELKVKAGLWGAVAGMVPVVAFILTFYFTDMAERRAESPPPAPPTEWSMPPATRQEAPRDTTAERRRQR